jgi:hypothetical protein
MSIIIITIIMRIMRMIIMKIIKIIINIRQRRIRRIVDDDNNDNNYKTKGKKVIKQLLWRCLEYREPLLCTWPDGFPLCNGPLKDEGLTKAGLFYLFDIGGM